MTTSSPTSPTSREARFRAVYEATYDDLLRFAQRRVHPSHAEDVAADAFLVAWRRADDLPTAPEDARAWLFGVARATLLNHRRGDRRRGALAVRIADARATAYDAAAAGSSAEGVADGVAGRVDLARAWGLLGDAEQEVLALTVFDGLDSAGAGTVLGCSATAYRLRLSRARRALRRHLDAPPADASHPTARSTETEGLQR